MSSRHEPGQTSITPPRPERHMRELVLYSPRVARHRARRPHRQAPPLETPVAGASTGWSRSHPGPRRPRARRARASTSRHRVVRRPPPGRRRKGTGMRPQRLSGRARPGPAPPRRPSLAIPPGRSAHPPAPRNNHQGVGGTTRKFPQPGDPASLLHISLWTRNEGAPTMPRKTPPRPEASTERWVPLPAATATAGMARMTGVWLSNG